MSRTRLILAAVAAASPRRPSAAGDAAAGRQKIFQCQGCHGIADWKTAFPEVYRVPKLGGQHAAYIVAALKAYKTGERDLATMRAIAADLSDKDMEDLAAYYAHGRRHRRGREMRRAMNRSLVLARSCLALSAPAFAAKGDADVGKKKSAPCKACHGEAGIEREPGFPQPRRPARRLPRRRAAPLQDRQAQEPDHGGPGGEPLREGHARPRRLVLDAVGARDQVLTPAVPHRRRRARPRAGLFVGAPRAAAL